MPSRGSAFIEALAFNMRLAVGGGLAVPLALLAAALYAASQTSAKEVAVNYLVESFAYSLYAIYLAMSMTAGNRGYLFELALFSSYRVLYTAKATAYALALLPASLTAAALGMALRVVDPAAVFVKLATTTSLFSTSLLLKDQRAATFYMVVMTALAPPATLTVITTILSSGYTLDISPLTIWAAYISPITTAIYKDMLDVHTVYAWALAISITAMAATYAAFKNMEIEPQGQ